MFKVGSRYILDGFEPVECVEVGPSAARFADLANEAEFVAILDDEGVWRHESSGDELMLVLEVEG